MNPLIEKQIRQVFADIAKHGQANDGLGLLRSANQLITLRYNLADAWVTAKSYANSMEADYKNKFDKRFLELRGEGKTIDEAKAQARMELSPDWVAYLEAEREKDKLTCLRDDIAEKVSIIQSFAAELRVQKTTHEL